MPTHPMLDDILRLPPEQRLQLVAEIWDSLARSPGDVPVPDWHRDLLDARLADPRERATLTWAEVRARVVDGAGARRGQAAEGS